MHNVYLSIGSNEGDRLKNISISFDLIKEKVGIVLLVSSIYENPPLGFEAELEFYNLCVAISTNLRPEELLFQLQQIEIEIGRDKKSINGNYSSRCIDLDILFYDDLILNSESLIIPHIHFKSRRFVLEPLAEISTNLVDPVSKKSIRELLERCTDESSLIRLF